ncbi:peptidoglycan DD-metalloendopeptidase family protein [Acidiferrobacter sp.]|uniref:peptidoglycan DD-metalloendopeptidase family protein n=1 Tax=Acidiferrobacter sp. TaxID=1872107 RepID=UPI002603D7A7|nr:peptidoglycan DD-metalloendopeptidase family protein [Acidiferrobacter sp.]
MSLAWGAFALLAGCVARIPAPIQDDSTSLGATRGVYRVLPGDTLYSIAFEFGRDYQALARWNHIPPPYRIEVGERLRLRPRPSRGAPLGPSGTPQAVRPVPRPAPRARRTGGHPVGPARPVRALRWIWPAQGVVKETFGRGPLSGRPGNRGIDILGRFGEPVRAAAAGRVVYRGSRLPGYGKLIIIKENNEYLSAYAHNAHIEVEEGAIVRQGEVIAVMGDSGTDRVELEFEIRRRGVPMDPLRYLPKRHH